MPAFNTSLRGLVDLTVEVQLLERPVHSGMFGGPVGDALAALCRLLATLHDERGDVAVAGLHVGRSAAPDLDPAVFSKDAGLLGERTHLGTGTLPERLWPDFRRSQAHDCLTDRVLLVSGLSVGSKSDFL